MAPKASATPARTTGRTTRQSATPGPVERPTRGKTPLPALDAKQSYAYGAKGKTELHSQVRTTTTDFSQALQANLEASKAPRESDPSPQPHEHRLPEGEHTNMPPASRQRQVPPPPLSGGNLGDPERTMTALDAGAEYDAGAGGDRAAERRHRAAAPNSLRELRLGAILGLVTAATVWISVMYLAKGPLPARYEAYRANLYLRLSHDSPAALEYTWFAAQHAKLFSDQLPEVNYEVPKYQWFINANILGRVEAVEAQMKSLQGDMSLQQGTLTALQTILPSHLAVQEIDGQAVIPEFFWQALQDRLSNGTDSAPLWKAFLSGNQRQVEDMNKESAFSALTQMVEEKHIVSKDYFAKAIAENNELLASKYENDFKILWANTFEHVRDVAAEVAGKEVARSSSATYSIEQLDVLARANQLHNVYEATRNINRFSPGNGARVDPYLTSPRAYLPAKSWLAAAVRLLALPPPNPPITALQRWDEANDCWCAAPSRKNGHTKAQIMVQTGVRIFPERLVVEHIPAAGTDNIAAAPRDIEIWAEMNSTKEAKRFAKTIEDFNTWQFEDPCKESPDPHMVCIGKGTYDIHMHNHVQTIPMFINSEQYQLNTDKILVRATTNWGAGWTCFYRLRMIGNRLNSPHGPEGCVVNGADV